MKNSILRLNLTILTLFIFFKCNSQNLNFEDLRYLLGNEIEKSDSYISERGFQFHESENGKESYCPSMTWSYDRDIQNNRAVAFVAKNCFKANEGFVWYQFLDRPTFDEIKKYCKTNGFEMIETEIDPFNNLCHKFENDKYQIEFCSGKNEKSNLVDYTITLRSR